MKAIGLGQIAINANEADLLVWNVPNEVINGFRLDDFEGIIGASETDVKVMFNELRQSADGVVLHGSQVRIACNALQAVINELGVDEFQIRTGHDLEEGLNILRDMNRFLSEFAEEAKS